jgi:hypothetical protein
MRVRFIWPPVTAAVAGNSGRADKELSSVMRWYMKGALVLSMILYCSCSVRNASGDFYEWVRDACENKRPCKVQLTDYNNSQWDRVYVFSPEVMDYEIKDVLGESVRQSGDYAYQIVFIKNNKVTKYFESIVNIDHEEDGSVFFMDIPPSAKYIVYDANVAFNVERQSNSFYLRCSNCAGTSAARPTSP